MQCFQMLFSLVFVTSGMFRTWMIEQSLAEAHDMYCGYFHSSVMSTWRSVVQSFPPFLGRV